jgi:hypothetical protein
MYMDKDTTSRDGAEEAWEAIKLLDDPPESLLALLSWEEADGQVTSVYVWESAADRGQVAAERVMPLFQQGILNEERHGSPHPVPAVKIFLRT